MNNNSCVWIGIGINISSEGSEYQELAELNQYLVEKFASKYVFNPINNQPHINLYDIDVPKSNLKEIETTLEQIVTQTKSFSIVINNIGFFEHGSIFIGFLLDNFLSGLESKVVSEIVPFRGNCRTEEYWQPWRKYNEKQIENREKYGNPHVLDSFVPHMTIGFVKTDERKLKEISQELNTKLRAKELICSHIDLVVHDENSKLLYTKRFNFK